MSTPAATRTSRRLERAEALRDRATTDGERQAAAAACDRLQRRLHQQLEADPIRQHVRAEFEALMADDALPRRSAMRPWRDQLLKQLARWEEGTLGDLELRRWALRVVDRNVLPSDPNQLESFWADVVLQLGSDRRGVVRPHHVPKLRRFLRHQGPPPWEAWFGWLHGLARDA